MDPNPAQSGLSIFAMFPSTSLEQYLVVQSWDPQDLLSVQRLRSRKLFCRDSFPLSFWIALGLYEDKVLVVLVRVGSSPLL